MGSCRFQESYGVDRYVLFLLIRLHKLHVTDADILHSDFFGFADKDMKLAVESVSARQVAKWVEESTGEKIKIVEVDDAKWPTLKEGSEELWTNMQWFYTHGGERDIELTNKLLPNALKTKTFIQSLGKKVIQ